MTVQRMIEIVKEFLIHLRATRKAGNTIKEYTQALDEFQEWLLENDRELCAQSVDLFLLDVANGWHPPSRPENLRRKRGDSTVAKIARGIRRFVRFASIDRGYIDYFKVGIPEVNEELERFSLTFEQVDKIAAYLDSKLIWVNALGCWFNPDTVKGVEEFRDKSKDRIDDRFSTQEKLRFWLLLETGCRAEEALNLSWGDIDLSRKVVFIRAEKTRDSHYSALETLWHRTGSLLESVEDKTGLLLHRMRRTREEREKGLTYSELQLGYQGLRKFFAKLNNKIDLGTRLDSKGQPQPVRFTPHDLRRTYITLSLQSGKPINAVQLQVGHKNLSTTQKYDRTTIDDIVRLLSGND